MLISGAGNFGCKCVLPLQLIRPRPRAVSSPYDKIDNLTTWIWLDCVNVMTTRTQLSKMKSCGVADRVFVSSVPSTIKRIRYTAIWCTTADINYHRLVMTKKWKNAETLGVRNKPTYGAHMLYDLSGVVRRWQAAEAATAMKQKFCKPGAHALQISKKSYSMPRKSSPGNLPVKLWLESWENPTWRIWRTFNATLPATSHPVTDTCFWTRATAMHHNQIYQPPHHYYIILIYCIDFVKIQKQYKSKICPWPHIFAVLWYRDALIYDIHALHLPPHPQTLNSTPQT